MATVTKPSSRAKGEADRFTKLVAEYRKAPEVTRQRLYLDTMQGLQQLQQGVVTGKDGQNNLLYLPLDKMVESGRNTCTPSAGASPPATKRRACGS
jgi:membrane protease subunit HflK